MQDLSELEEHTKLVQRLRNLCDHNQAYRIGGPTCDTIEEAANAIETLEKVLVEEREWWRNITHALNGAVEGMSITIQRLIPNHIGLSSEGTEDPKPLRLDPVDQAAIHAASAGSIEDKNRRWDEIRSRTLEAITKFQKEERTKERECYTLLLAAVRNSLDWFASVNRQELGHLYSGAKAMDNQNREAWDRARARRSETE